MAAPVRNILYTRSYAYLARTGTVLHTYNQHNILSFTYALHVCCTSLHPASYPIRTRTIRKKQADHTVKLPAHLNLFQSIRIRGVSPSHPPHEFLQSCLYTLTCSSATKQGEDMLPASHGPHCFRTDLPWAITMNSLKRQESESCVFFKNVCIFYIFLSKASSKVVSLNMRLLCVLNRLMQAIIVPFEA
jgi:hypothetical protein